MLLSAVSDLVVAQSIFEIPEGLMNNPVYSEYHLTAMLYSVCSVDRLLTVLYTIGSVDCL